MPRRPLGNTFARAVIAACCLEMGTAHAAPSGDAALAESLFQEAKKLMAKKRFAEACPKLAESQRLDPGGGTLFTLAICHEGEGKLASAWSELTEAAALARRDNRADRERIAKARVKALENKLVYLVIAVPKVVPSGFELKRDGSPMGEAAWRTPVPIDPGEHEISATAPGRKPWSTKVTVRPDERETTVTLPELQELPPAPAAPAAAAATGPSASHPSAPADKGHGGPPRAVGIIVAGVGLATVGVGAFFGVRASSQVSDANEKCPTSACTDPAAIAANEDGNRNAVLPNILVGAGGVVLAAGVVLYFLGADSKSSGSARLTPWIGRGGGGASLSARW